MAIASTFPVSSLAGDDQKISALTIADKQRMNEHRDVVKRRLTQDDLRTKYPTAAGKLGAIRAFLSSGTLKPHQVHEIRSLGIVFGDVFVQDLGLSWVVVEDKFGRELALRYKETSILLFPQSMLLKRIERGEAIDIFDLYNSGAAKVLELAKAGY